MGSTSTLFPLGLIISTKTMIQNCSTENLKPYLLWAAELKLGMHCKTVYELAELLTIGRNSQSVGRVGLNIARVGREINQDMCPERDPNVDWFAQQWPFIAQQDGYTTYP